MNYHPRHIYICTYYFQNLFNYIYVHFYFKQSNIILCHVSSLIYISGLSDWVIPLCSVPRYSLICFPLWPLSHLLLLIWSSLSIGNFHESKSDYLHWHHQPLTKRVVYRNSLRCLQWIESKLKYSILFTKMQLFLRRTTH